MQWFGSAYTHKWGSLKSAYATVVGKVGKPFYSLAAAGKSSDPALRRS